MRELFRKYFKILVLRLAVIDTGQWRTRATG